MSDKGYKDLEVWKLGVEISNMTYSIVDTFPKRHQYGIGSHMEKTSLSIPSNISEGKLRDSDNELRRFLGYSLGSCAELETQYIIACQQGFLEKDVFDEVSELLNKTTRKIRKFKNGI